MGFAASARRLAFGAAATVATAMPLSHADAQSRAIPANSSRPVATAPATRVVSSPTRTNNPRAEAQIYSEGNVGVGIFIYVSEAAKQKGYTGDILGREVVDSLKARGVPSRYFFSDTPTPGGPTLINAYINGRSYVNEVGSTAFGPISIRREFSSIKAKYLSAPMTSATIGGTGPSQEPQ
jgi:hypothetical protein